VPGEDARRLPFDPLSDGSASFGEAAEVVQPGAFLFETAKEPFDEAILPWRIGCNELLTGDGNRGRRRESAGSGRCVRCHCELPGVEPFRTQSAEACQAGLFERSLGLWRDHARRTRSQSLRPSASRTAVPLLISARKSAAFSTTYSFVKVLNYPDCLLGRGRLSIKVSARARLALHIFS
jgi:hypothetical protein